MDRRTFTKLIGLLALPSKKSLGEVLRNPKIVVVGAGIIGRNQSIETIVREKPKIGRNEKVTIKNINTGETKVLKFKQAEILIKKGEWVISS